MRKKYPTPTKYKLISPEKYIGDKNNIIMRSSWEKGFARWCDSNPAVLKWGSETRAIPYYSQVDRRVRDYYIDFFILLQDKNGIEKKFLVEIKPYYQTRPPVCKNKRKYLEECITFQRNQDKWRAAIDFANKNKAEFLILTERELGIR